MTMESKDPIALLLRLTGPRPAVPADRAARVKAAVRADWRAAVERGARRRTRWRLAALAAILTVAVAVPLMRGWRPGSGPAPEAARIELGSGAAERGTSVPAGSVLATGDDERLALRMVSGPSVRLDTATRARIDSGGAVELLAGAIYVDSGDRSPGGGSAAIAIRTPLGPVRDLGTQFEVRLVTAGVRLRVREGTVSLERPAGSLEVRAGRELLAGADGSAREDPLADPAGAWAWIGAITPMMAIDGRTLPEFLAWFGRERGLEIRYADRDLAAAAAAIRLNGSIDGMTLDESLASVLAISRLEHRIEGTSLFIERPAGAQ